LGRFTLVNPIAAFPPRGLFARHGAAGNIGGGILRRFKVIFDYSRSRLILEPNKNFADPYEYDMSGLQLVSDSPSFNTITIDRTLHRSPAAEAGLKPGDQLLFFEGRPIADYSLARLRELFRVQDRIYHLQVRRNEVLLSVKLKTRRLI
jgi:predicted metalloprotease with PDZ domain